MTMTDPVDTLLHRIAQHCPSGQYYADYLDDEIQRLPYCTAVGMHCLQLIAQAEALILAMPDSDQYHDDIRLATVKQCEVYYFG